MPHTTCERRLQVTIFRMEQANFQGLGVYRFRIEVRNSENMPREVFLYRRHPLNPYTGQEVDECCGVCSPVDLEEYPVGAPSPDRDLPFFRKHFIDIVTRSTAKAHEARDEALKHLGILIEGLCRMDVLVLEDVFWIPSPPPGSASVSVSV